MAKKMTFGAYITQTLLVVVPVSLLFGYGSALFLGLEKGKIIPCLGAFLVAGVVISCAVVVKNYSRFMKPLNQILSLAQYLESGDLSKKMDLD